MSATPLPVDLTTDHPTTAGPPPSSATVPGPISKLPPEVLCAILDHLLESCAEPLERQTEWRRFLRVSRGFRFAHELSSAAHECAVKPGRPQALRARLTNPGLSALSVHSIWIWISSEDEDEMDAIESVVLGCASGLRDLTWSTTKPSKSSDLFGSEQISIVAQCTKLDSLRIDVVSYVWSLADTQLLLGALHNLQILDLPGVDLLYEPSDTTNTDFASWVLPTKLRCLTLKLETAPALALFAALVRASASTLRHLGLDYTGVHDNQLVAAVQPVASTLTSLCINQADEYADDFVWYAPVLETLPRLRSIEIPAEAIADEAVGAALRKYKTLCRLRLYNHTGQGTASVDDVEELVKDVEVGRLEVGQQWWRDCAEIEMAQVEGDYGELVRERMEERRKEVAIHVGNLELI